VKAWIAFGIVGITSAIGITMGFRAFDVAAADICGAYAGSQGWEVTDSAGALGRNWRLRIPPRRNPDFRCTFEDQFGQTVFLDELDDVIPRTGRSRWLRFGGWAVMIAFPAGGVILSGLVGLLPGRD